ncbi:hypothetical protein JL722_689 [Aureococcus anophagefferens]|nr:hypothetical protein JL722_689 [Aureococcus anophagefferens]
MPLSYLDGKPLKYTGTVRVAREDLDRDAIDGSILDMVREARAVRERAARPSPRPAAGPWRCHVCTLAAGTCEHSPHWFARRVADARRAKDAKLDAARLEVARAVHERRPCDPAVGRDLDDAEDRLFLDDIFDVVSTLPGGSTVLGYDDGATAAAPSRSGSTPSAYSDAGPARRAKEPLKLARRRRPAAAAAGAAAAAACGDHVAVFGGTNATACDGSLWLFHVARGTWTEPIVVGPPPRARFGHALLPLPSDDGAPHDAGAFRAPLPVTRLLVFGGCDESVVAAHGAGGRGGMAAPGPFERALGAGAEDLAALYDGEARSATRRPCAAAPRAPAGAADAARLARAASRAAGVAAADAARREARAAERSSALAEDRAAAAPRGRPARGPRPTSRPSRAAPLRRAAAAAAAARDAARSRARRRTSRSPSRRRPTRSAPRGPRAGREAAQAAAPRDPPAARYGAAVAAIGHRVFVHGGWGLGPRGPVAVDELRVLDLEGAAQREEREEIEFHERLEHERSRRDASDAREARMVAYVAKIALADWAAREAVERVWMGREHVASLVPPLTRAPDVTLASASATTLWLRWRAVPFDAKRQLCDATFVLSMKGGFRAFARGDRVDVEYEPKRPGGGGGADSPSRDDASLASTATLDTWDGARPRERFDATVTADHLDGHFSVLYDDGTREARVPRRRLQLKDDGPWHIVHYGPENHDAVEALVPDKFVADEPGIAVSAKFMLQTTGTEYGWDAAKGAVVASDEGSLPSPVAVFATRNARAPIPPDNRTRARLQRALDAGVDIRHAGCDFTAEGRGRHFV